MSKWELIGTHGRAIERAHPRPQTEASLIGDHRLRTSCGVFERPDHHCGGDLVFITQQPVWFTQSATLTIVTSSAGSMLSAQL